MDELLAEIMRRVEANWGDDASEGPYCKQEIVEGVREVLDGLKADAARIVDRAARLVMDDLARKASDQVDLVDAKPLTWQVGDVVPMRDLIPRAPMFRCTVLPVEP